MYTLEIYSDPGPRLSPIFMQKPSHIAVKEFLVNSPRKNPKGIFLLAHGAGKGAASPFLETIAQGAINSDVRVVRFNFPYMEGMLRTGKKKSPNSGEVLRKCFSDVVSHCIEREQVPSKYIIVGGKSMGARAASMIADEHQVGGVVCLSYPFHPPRKPEPLRITHLQTIQTPTLICQGEKDPNGGREEVQQFSLSKSVQFHWLADGDNNFKPPETSDRSQQENMADATEAINRFIDDLL
jgi:predicted alpha/beta-hydrolase family hydrolase